MDALPNDTFWEGKKVVELGSGLGVTAATLIHLGASVVCTDGEESVVTQLKENLDNNFKGHSHENDTNKDNSCKTVVYDCVNHLWGGDTSNITSSSILKINGESQVYITFHK